MGEGQGGHREAKRKWRDGDLLADERCSPAVLDFLRGTYVGRAAPPVEETWDSEGEGDGAVGGDPEAEGGRGLWSSDPRARFSLLFLLLRVIAVFTVLLLLLSGGRGDEGAAMRLPFGAGRQTGNGKNSVPP